MKTMTERNLAIHEELVLVKNCSRLGTLSLSHQSQ